MLFRSLPPAPPYTPSLISAALCHRACPQSNASYTALDQSWRNVAVSGSSVGYEDDCTTSDAANHPMGSGTTNVADASWYQFTGSAGSRMATEAPGHQMCGTCIVDLTGGAALTNRKSNDEEGTLKLMESHHKVLFANMCVVLLKPAPQDQLTTYQHYACPVYRTTARRGVLSTTGQSTNFVVAVDLPTDREPHHWVSMGVAMLCALAE